MADGLNLVYVLARKIKHTLRLMPQHCTNIQARAQVPPRCITEWCAGSSYYCCLTVTWEELPVSARRPGSAA